MAGVLLRETARTLKFTNHHLFHARHSVLSRPNSARYLDSCGLSVNRLQRCVYSNGTDSIPRNPVAPRHYLVPMPELSPLMKQGTIVKWHVRKGDSVEANTLMFDVETKTLTEREDHAFVLEVESQEDGFVAAVFVPEGGEVAVGAPIAIVCDNKEDLSYFVDHVAPAQVDADKAYNDRTFLWQAYVKSHKGLDM
mmetsp:Transcript_25571/g.48401  ORF Transcript_25571/g.48401 Transcript_25571/m.48401 type:complete len:195 (-) Transcript_25571:167-751(-)